MKNIIYFLILTLWVGIATSVFAQNYDCVGEVRTTTPTVNIWDWRQPTYPVFIKNDQNTPGLRDTLRSPFETGQFSYNENTAHLAMPLIKDYDPADGWELVYKSFGTGTSSINAVIAPAFALYNKHTGVLRAFSFITSVPLISNGALMSIEFIYPRNLPSRKETALFTHMESKAHPLINFTKAAKVKATNLFRRSAGGYWLYAEFVTGYDPCACAHQTQLSVVPEIHKVSNVFLSTTGTVTQIIDNGTTKDTGFQTVMKVVEQAAEAGSKAHKSTDDFLKNFAKILYNQPTVKRDSIAGNNDKKEEIKKEFDLFPNWVKGIPKLANIIGIADFILNIGDTNKETPPISYEVNLKTTGTISSEAKFDNPKITVPGSDNAGVQPSIIPYYNNTMGVFNLLKYPTLKYVEYEPFPTKKVRYVNSNGQSLHTYEIPKVREYQLAAPLEFVLNPAAELEVVDMKTSFVVDLKLPEISAAFPIGMNQALTEDNKFTYGPFEKEPTGRARLSTKYEERIYDESGLELLLWQDDAYDVDANGKRSYRISKTLYGTTPVNTGFFNKSKFRIFRNLTNLEPEIFCKITLIVRRKNKPNAPDQIMVFTYNIKAFKDAYAGTLNYNFKFPAPVSSGGVSTYVYQYNYPNLRIGTISPSPFDGITAIRSPKILRYGNQVFDYLSAINPLGTRYADNIVISGDITTNSNYFFSGLPNLSLSANESITLETGTVIDSNTSSYPNYEVVLGIGGLSEIPVTPFRSKDEIKIFCGQAGNYNPITTARLVAPYENPTKGDTKVDVPTPTKSAQLLSVYPNPTTGEATITYEVEKEGSSVAIYLTNNLGVRVMEVSNEASQVQGTHNVRIDTRSLAAGVYFYTLVLNGVAYTERLVVIK